MNLLDYDRFVASKKELDLRITLYVSGLFSIIFFVLLLFSGSFGIAFGTLIFSFIFLFGLTYGVLFLQTKGVLKKLKDLELEGPFLPVTFRNEQGVLVFTQDKLIYHGLLMGSNNKHVEIPIDEDLFMAFGEYNRKKRHELKYGQYKKCHITLRKMPHGVFYQFSFFDVDGLQEKVGEQLNQVSQFNSEKWA